jgi:predicted MFS family arabinose efflux permease
VPTNTSRWGTLAVTSLYVIAICISYQTIPPVLSLIIEDLGIGHAQAGLLMSVFTLSGVFVAIPLSLFVSKHGKLKQVGIASLCLVIVGLLLMMFAEDFALLMAGRLVIGISAGTLPVNGQPVIARAFRDARLGLAMGLYGTLMPICTVIPLISFGAAGLAWGWRSTIIITLAIAVVALIVYIAFFKPPPEFPAAGQKKEVINVKSALKIGWPIWMMAVCWGCFAFGNLSLMTFLPDLIYRSGVDLNVAGSITSIVMVCGLAVSPLSGYILDGMKHKAVFIIAGGLVNTVLMFFVPINVGYIIMFVLLIGIFSAPVPPTISAIVPGLTSPQKLSLAFSILFTVNNIGLSLGPYIIGFLRDLTGSYVYSFWFMSIFFFMVAVLGIVLLIWQARTRMAKTRLI